MTQLAFTRRNLLGGAAALGAFGPTGFLFDIAGAPRVTRPRRQSCRHAGRTSSGTPT